MIFHSYHFPTVTFATAQVQVECKFHHRKYPVATNYAWYFWRIFVSSGIVCDLPKLQDSPETYTARLVIDDEIFYASAPLQVIKPRKVQHKLCQCLVMWKRSEFMLKYLERYTDVHSISTPSHLLKSETMPSLKWLQALNSIELIHWPHLYTQVSMTSYCTLLAQQQCEWVAQWDVDEFLYLPDNARLVDYLQDIPSNAHSVLLKLHFVQMFANETFLRTPSSGVLRNYRCSIDSMVSF